MAWLESHGNLARHPKTRRLMQRMGWTLPHTIGNLHLLWYWALEYAPTGDLTKFEPEQLTYDLDLNGATPEQFLEAMVEAGFIDRGESGTFRLHDWPDYTAKSLRPKFRRTPEKWHQVLSAYNLPIPPPRKQRALSHASRNDEMVGPAGRRTSAPDPAPQQQPELDPAHPPANVPTETSRSDESVATEQQMANMRRLKAEVPRALSLIPGFVEVWWPRLLDMYKTKGTPLDPNQRRELLARLCMRPNSAIKLLKLCVEHSLNCKWEHLDNTA